MSDKKKIIQIAVQQVDHYGNPPVVYFLRNDGAVYMQWEEYNKDKNRFDLITQKCDISEVLK